jgi:hypothetical protein
MYGVGMTDHERPTTGALVWRLAMRWRAAVDRAVAPLGLTHGQYSALASLRALTSRGERPSQRRLAAYTGLEPIYVSKLVRALERGGLVARVPDPADQSDGAGEPGDHGEDPRLAPTTAGGTAYRPVRGTVSRVVDELYRDLPPADLEATHRTLVEVTRRANARLATASG